MMLRRAASFFRPRGAGRVSREPFLQQVIPLHQTGAELGVYLGEFTAELLSVTAPRKLHLIDPWYRLGAEWDWGPKQNRSTVEALAGIMRRYTNELVSGQAELHIGGDLDVLATFPDSYFDWVYVDSSHAYEHTYAELEILERKVKPEGVIAGDDWRPDPTHRHHGVYRAVMEWTKAKPYALVYGDTTDLQWAIRRR